MDKKKLSETDIPTKFITPAIQAAGWDLLRQVREEVTFTAVAELACGCSQQGCVCDSRVRADLGIHV